MSRLDLVEASLLAMGKKCVRRGDRLQGQCPAHDDRSPSFHAKETADGAVLFHCFGGCSGVAIMDALRLRWDQIKPEGYREPGVRRHRESTPDVDGLVIEIARADRAAGKRASEKDKLRELEAFNRLRSQRKAIPEGAPTLREIAEEATKSGEARREVV